MFDPYSFLAGGLLAAAYTCLGIFMLWHFDKPKTLNLKELGMLFVAVFVWPLTAVIMHRENKIRDVTAKLSGDKT